MKILYSPQRSDEKIEYTFENETITATLSGTTDTFDFSTFPDGQANIEKIDTILPVNPIVSAERQDGTLYIKLLNYIGDNATHEERFPQWQEVV